MKRFIILIPLLLLSACDLFFLPGFSEKIVNATNPFDEIGNVVGFVPSMDPNNAILRGVMLSELYDKDPDETNCFYVFYDFSDSIYKPSQYTSHQPFLSVTEFGLRNLSTAGSNFLDTNRYTPANIYNYKNELIQSPYQEDVYYIKIALDLITNYAFLTNGITYTKISLRPMNYLNTPEGISALDWNNYFSIIGYQDLGTQLIYITLTNINGVIKIDDQIDIINFGVDIGDVTTAYYITPDKKAVGFKVNGVQGDWSLQTAGMSELAAGTRIRLMWTNISATMTPYNPWFTPGLGGSGIWEGWPENAVVTGSDLILHTSNRVWYPSEGKSVFIDPHQNKAVVDIDLITSHSPGFTCKLSHSGNPSGTSGQWGYPSEEGFHALVLPQPVNGAITVYMNASLNWTNI